MAAANILWLVLAAAVQLVWGWYPAALRFLQTKAPHKLTSLQLSTLINTFPLPVVLIQSLLLWSHGVAYRRGHAAALDAMQHKRGSRATLAGPSDSLQEPLLAGAAEGAETPANGETALANGTVHAEGAGPQPSRPSLWKKAGFLAITTTALTSLMVSQIFALLFVEAYISQMVFLLAPLLVSFLALAVLHTPLPPKFWPTLLLMLAGSGLVVGGKAMAAGGEAASAAAAAAGSSDAMAGSSQWLRLLGWEGLHTEWLPGSQLGLLMYQGTGVINWNDVAGIGLSFMCASSLAVFMLTVQVAGPIISEAEVLGVNYPTQAVLSLLLTYTLERPRFHVFGQLLAWEWATVGCVSLVVNWMGNLLQQITIKRLGAPQVAAFLPLRLVGSLIASYVILAEGLDNALEGAGALLVMATLTWYLYIQKKHADSVTQRMLLEEIATEGGVP